MVTLPPSLAFATCDAATASEPLPVASQDIHRMTENMDRERLRDLGKTFGGIPGIPIFMQWENRKQCCNSAVHRSIIAGICGNKKDGVFSIVLSSLYKDDEDGGNTILYTGTGGRERWSRADPPKRLRIGPQTMDQSWDHPSNQALIVSSLTGNPVRVIRSWKCPSPYAPSVGYRYDGLYQISTYWTAKGHNGKNICRCRLDRLHDQPPIPERPTIWSMSRTRNRQRLISPIHSSSPPTDILDEPSSGFGLQGAVSTSAGTDFDMGSVDVDLKDALPPLPERGVPHDVSALARYRWDPERCQLVQVATSHQIPQDHQTGREDDDDATLVPL